jgi:hypothetical protein
LECATGLLFAVFITTISLSVVFIGYLSNKPRRQNFKTGINWVFFVLVV